MKIFIILITLFGFFISCGNRRKPGNPEFGENLTSNTPAPLIIDIDKIEKPGNFRELIEEIDFVPLETTDESILEEIDKVVSHKGRFYILDERGKSLKIFTHDGEYVRSVGRVGHGPGEFTFLMDFSLDTARRTLMLLSNDKQAVLEFDLDGNYIKTFKNNLYGNQFERIGDNWYYFLNQNINQLSGHHNLIVMDSTGMVKDRLFPFPETFRVSLGFSGFISGNQEGILYNALSDTIFQLTGDGQVYPKYILDFGDYTFPPSIRKSSDESGKVRLKYALLENHVIESANFLSFVYQKERSIITAFCPIKRKAVGTGDERRLTPFRLNFPLNGFPLGLQGDDEFITYVPIQFINWVKKGLVNEEFLKRDYPGLYQLVPQLEITDNPVLVVYKLKR